MSDIKRRVQEQFGAHATNFVTSRVHAQGYSLNRLIELVRPQPDWIIVDMATGGGHNALSFSRHTTRVIACDLTHPMLVAARNFIVEQGADQVEFCRTDAEEMPFASDSVDCVTCRIAPHHFPNVARFVEESARVIRPGGFVAVVDNVVGGAHIADYINALEKLRDPSHHWAYSLEDWETFYVASGLDITASEVFEKEIDFDDWAARVGVTGSHLLRLRAMLVQAPKAPLKWLRPREIGSNLLFSIREGIIVGRKPSPQRS